MFNQNDMEIVENYSTEIKKAITIRLVEERLLSLFSEGYLNGTVHTAVGQEFTGVFISKYLNSNDFVTSNHRGHGHYLARYGNIRGLISEIMGKEEGLSGGYGGSQHIADENYLSNGIQGGMLPIAAGVSFYFKRKNLDSISVSYIGDGTLGEGLVYETFNLSSILGCPFLIVLENNGYAQSTSFKQTFIGDLKKRSEGFGIKYFHTTTFDLHNLDRVCNDAVLFVRNESKPAIIEIQTYRLNSHSKGDDNRNKLEIESFRKKDLLSNLFNENVFDTFIQETKSEIELIVEQLKQSKTLSTISEASSLFSYKSIKNINVEIDSHERYNTLIYDALKNIFSQNQDVIMIGEDIQNKTEYTNFSYGGAFKVTKDLSDLFPGRVINTPISESAIAGFITGYSLKAGRSFVEIMFGDFSTLIFDQILQHASKFHQMYNGKVSCPIVVRTPMGGKRGYGPTHSQSIEKHFLGIAGFSVIALHHRISPNYIFNAIMSIKTPLMLIENKILYTIETSKRKLPLYDYSYNDSLFPELYVKPKNNQSLATIACYGETLNVVEDVLFEMLMDDELFFDIVCPTLLSEINISILIESVRKTKNLFIIEEGSGFASWGSEIVTLLNENGVNNFKLTRVHNSKLIPSSYNAEMALLPTVENIKLKLKEILSL